MPVLSRTTTRRLGLVSLLAGLGAGAGGAEPLARTSPFLPAASANAAPAAAADTPLELRGIMQSGDEIRFSLYDPTRRSSSWVRLNELGRDFIVRSYDEAKDAVTVDFQGRSVTLVLKTAKIASAPFNPTPQPGLVPGQPGGPGAQPVGGPVVLNPTPADEQRRLEAIAAEVNRRRQLRQQAMQQQPAPQPK